MRWLRPHCYRRWLGASLIVGFIAVCPTRAADEALDPFPVNVHPGAVYSDTARQFQGIPGIARAANGRLWATWYSGGVNEGPDNYVLLATSADNGATWSKEKAVIDPPGAVRAYDPVIWIDPSGKLWWFHAQSYEWWDGRAGVWSVTTSDPESESPAWSQPRRIADGIMMNKPTVTASGDWLLPISTWAQEPSRDPKSNRFVPADHVHWRAADVGAHVYLSKDKGQTFSLLATVAIPEPQFDEHMIVERKDHGLWMLARNHAGIVESSSVDGGKTWLAAKASPIPHIPSRFYIRRLRSGHLLLVKHNPQMDTAWLDGKNVPNVWLQRSNLTAYLSDDDGHSWHGGLLIDGRVAVSYPDADQAPDGRIYLIYDFNRTTDKEILMASLTEEDIAAGHIVSPQSHLRMLVDRASGGGPK